MITSRNMSGFTLVEVMVVVAILSILAAFAWSSYQESVISSGRADAKSELNDTAQRLQRCFTANNTYSPADGVCSVVDELNGAGGITSRGGYYSITANLTQTTYVLTAAPVAGKRQAADTRCGSLTLNQAGQRGASGADPRCW